MESVFDVQSLHISLFQITKSISEDMEVKGKSLLLGWHYDLLV